MWALRLQNWVFCAEINRTPGHVRSPMGRKAAIQRLEVTVGILAGGSRGSVELDGVASAFNIGRDGFGEAQGAEAVIARRRSV